MKKQKIVLISGKQGSGKTTLSRKLRDRLENNKIMVVNLKFAQVIYEIHDTIWNIMNRYGIEREIEKDGVLLQLLGTEWGRNSIGEDIWVNCLKNYIHQHPYNPDILLLFIIDDCRFKNEFDAFPNATSIRLECNKDIRKQRCTTWRDNDNHQSETDLDDYARKNKFDLVLDTSELTIEEMVEITGNFIETLAR